MSPDFVAVISRIINAGTLKDLNDAIRNIVAEGKQVPETLRATVVAMWAANDTAVKADMQTRTISQSIETEVSKFAETMRRVPSACIGSSARKYTEIVFLDELCFFLFALECVWRGQGHIRRRSVLIGSLLMSLLSWFRSCV